MNKEVKKIKIGSSDIVHITKMFGPTSTSDLKIELDLDNYEWVIKKDWIEEDEEGNDLVSWEEVARFSAEFNR